MKRATMLMLPVGIFSAVFSVFLIWFLFTRLTWELTLTLQVILGAIALAGVVVSLAFAVFGAGAIYQGFERSKERTKQARMDTAIRGLEVEKLKVSIVLESRRFHNAGPGDQVYQFDALTRVTTPLHLQPGPTNGVYVEPSQREEERWTVNQLAHGKRGQLASGRDPEPMHLESGPTAQASLMDLLTLEQRIALDGPSGSGKSSLLRRIVACKLPVVDQVILCDPHGSRPKWGEGIDAVGFGEKFDAILDCFAQLEWLHTQRIREVAEGAPERSFPIVLVVIEEVQALVEFYKKNKAVDIGHYIRMFLTRTRKTSIDVIVVTQVSTVKALGLEGYGKNRDAFAFAKTMGRQGRGHRVEYVNEYGESSIFDAPPLWPDTKPVGVQPQKVAQLSPAPTSEQYRIIDCLLADPGASDYKISMEVWGKRGSSYTAKIEEVRQLFGPFVPSA